MSERTYRLLVPDIDQIEGTDICCPFDVWNPAPTGDIGKFYKRGWVPFLRPVHTAWPAPRYDDPAKCGDPERMILEWSHGAGGGSYWGARAKDWTPGRAWLEQPPAPVPQKSEAEIAWEANERASCGGVSGMDKHSFIQGFECHTLTAKGKP